MIINFNSFLFERKDLEKSKYISKVASDILDKYLDKIKKLINNNEQLNVHIQDPKFNILYYKNNYKILFANNTSPGEIFVEKKEIYISNEIVNIINSIKNKSKKEAINIFNNLLKNEDLLYQIKNILVHELAHKEDPYNYKKEDNYIKKLNNIRSQLSREYDNILKSKNDKLYYNLSTEYNSFYLTFCSQLLDIIKQHPNFLSKNNFENILNLFKKSNKSLFNNINEKNKKRLINRLYNFYNELIKI